MRLINNTRLIAGVHLITRVYGSYVTHAHSVHNMQMITCIERKDYCRLVGGMHRYDYSKLEFHHNYEIAKDKN